MNGTTATLERLPTWGWFRRLGAQGGGAELGHDPCSSVGGGFNELHAGRGFDVTGLADVSCRSGRSRLDAMVRQAFLEGCVQQGGARGNSRNTRSIGATAAEGNDQDLREILEDASRRATVAWMAIDSYLEQYDELAVMALERCNRGSVASGQAAKQHARTRFGHDACPRRSRRLRPRDHRARSRARARFWGSRDTSAA